MSKLLELAKSSILTKRKDFLDMVKFIWQEGASNAETYLFHGCVKVGDRSTIKSQIKAHEYLEESMGSAYDSVFPRLQLISERGNTAVLLIEFLDGRNLEDVCFEMRDILPFLSIENPIVQKKLSMITMVVGQCVEKLYLIFKKTKKDNDNKESLLTECFDALEVNLVDSNLKDYFPVVQELKRKQEIFLDPLVSLHLIKISRSVILWSLIRKENWILS